MKKYILIILFFGLFSCDHEEFLAEDPKSEVTEVSFFGPNTSETAVEQFVNNIYYTGIWEIWDRRWPWLTVGPGDAFRHSTVMDVEGQNYDNNNFTADDFNVFRLWNYRWWPIGRANIFMDKYENLEELFGDKWSRLKWMKGQVLFLRAYNYFILTIGWGPVPMPLTPADGRDYSNSSVPELYNQIITDLNEIIDNNLCPPYPQVAQEDLGRITDAAAKSLLAKVYLTRAYSEYAEAGDIDKAVSFAKDVIDNSGHDLITEPLLGENGDTLFTAYERAFLPPGNSIEGIWEFQFATGAQGSKINEEWVPRGYYGNYGKGRFEATSTLYNSFESNDERKKAYITGDVISPWDGEIVECGEKIYMTKYHEPDYSLTARRFTNNWPYLRFADILLIYAEALNMQNNGPTPAAYEAINRVRNRVGLEDLSGGYNKESFLNAIQNERYKELAGEGHRVFDLRRWGYETYKERVESANPNANVQSHNMLWPIPSYEMQQNALIEQNSGY